MFNLPVYFLKSELDAPDTGGQGVLVQVFLCRQLLIGHPFQIQPFQQIQLFLGDQTLQFQVGPRRWLEGLVGQRGLGLEQAGGPLLVGADHVSDHVVYRVVQPAGGIGAGKQVLPFGPGNGKRLLDRLLRPPRIGRLGVPGQKGLGVPDQFAVMGAEQGLYLPGNELHFGCGHGGTLLFFLLP